MSEAILDISWKDYFLDEIIEGMPPGFGFSAFRDHSENREAKPYYVTVWKLTWRGKDIGRLIFDDHIRRVTYINGKSKWDPKVSFELEDPKCTPAEFIKIISEPISRLKKK
jgi:hypothetical protein